MNHDRYTILELLGEGGWGEVTLAVDTATKNKVAIKRVPIGDLITEESVATEINALSRLNHPGVIKYLDSFADKSSIHVVMEYVEGQTLEQIIADGPLPLDRVERYNGQIIEALDYVHSQGIIHSDLKPENIMVDPNDRIRIIDFGIVRTASAEIAADIKDIRGTLHYMSPEQAEGNPYDIRSDLFSLGVMLYELCCGSKPFSGDYDMAVVYAILYEEPVPPNKINSDIHPALSETIMKLLAKAPSARPESAAQVKAMLPTGFMAERGAISVGIHHMAILPFEYPEGDEDSRLIADGLKDELYERLRQLQDLKVASPVKVTQHRDHLTDGRAIRNTLGVDDYLSGRVRRMGSQIRIYLMLIDTTNDSVIWSDKVDTAFTDLFDVIDRITEQVTEKVKAQLVGETVQPVVHAATTRPEAYELYLLARGYYIKYGEQDFKYARNMFQEALKLDPTYALAMIGIADCYCAEYMNYFDRSDAAIMQATEWAQQALEQVPNLPEAYRTLGRIMQTTGRIREASTYFLKAATYKEDHYLAYRSLGWLSKDCFKYNDALKWIRKTLSINSTDLETIFLKGLVHFERKESKQAINDFTRCLELRPDYGRAHSFRGMTYFQLGRVGDAIASLQQAIDFGGDINAPYLLGYYYLCDHSYLKGINTLLEATTRPEISFLAWFYLGLARLLIDQRNHIEDCFVAARNQSAVLLKDVPDLSIAIAVHASCLAILGDTDGCRAEMTALIPFIEYDGSAAHDLARIYALLGDREQCARSSKIAVETCQGPTQVEIDLDPILNHFLERCR